MKSKDTERLDRMQKFKVDLGALGWCLDEGFELEPSLIFELPERGSGLFVFRSIRKALDAAMKAERKEKKP